MNVRHLKHTLLVNLDNMKNEPPKGGGEAEKIEF